MEANIAVLPGDGVGPEVTMQGLTFCRQWARNSATALTSRRIL